MDVSFSFWGEDVDKSIYQQGVGQKGTGGVLQGINFSKILLLIFRLEYGNVYPTQSEFIKGKFNRNIYI